MNSKIKNKLGIILNHFVSTRQVGHTTVMKEGVNAHPESLVLVHSSDNAKALKLDTSQIVSLNTLERLRGSKKPLVIDNAAMYSLLSETLHYISSLEEHIDTEIQRRKQAEQKLHTVKSVLV